MSSWLFHGLILLGLLFVGELLDGMPLLAIVTGLGSAILIAACIRMRRLPPLPFAQNGAVARSLQRSPEGVLLLTIGVVVLLAVVGLADSLGVLLLYGGYSGGYYLWLRMHLGNLFRPSPS